MGRRSNGEGSIKKLPSGSWRGQLMDGYNVEGKRNMLSFTAPTKGEVQRQIREYLAAKEAGEVLLQTKGKSFAYWADLWYEDHKTQVQPSTYSGYKYTLKLLKGEFADKSIADIKPVHISKFLNEMLNDKCSTSKVNKCRAMLIQIFEFAEGNDAVKRNPARLTKTVRNMEGGCKEKDAFNDDEVQKLLAELPRDKLGHSIRLLLGSGIRVQELLALTRSDISEDGSLLEINRAVKIVDGKAVVGPTKSKAGTRIIPIPKSYRESALYLREHSGESFVWCSGRGSLVHSVGTFRKWYYRALKEVGEVRRLAPHSCRHTYVSRLEARGVPMEQIARLVGHTKIATTNGYLHVPENVLLDAVNTLNETKE